MDEEWEVQERRQRARRLQTLLLIIILVCLIGALVLLGIAAYRDEQNTRNQIGGMMILVPMWFGWGSREKGRRVMDRPVCECHDTPETQCWGCVIEPCGDEWCQQQAEEAAYLERLSAEEEVPRS